MWPIRIDSSLPNFPFRFFSELVLDEIDVLLPPKPKALRTKLDGSAAQRERKSQEQKRKLRAAQRRGVEFIGGSGLKGDSVDLSNAMNSQVLTPTERVLRLVASARYVGDTDGASLQILAGSATGELFFAIYYYSATTTDF